MTVRTVICSPAKYAMTAKARACQREKNVLKKARQELRSGKTAKSIIMYPHALFKKGDGSDGRDGQREIYRDRHHPSPRHPEKIKNRFIITAPIFQKNAFTDIVPTFGDAVIKTDTAPT